MIEPNIKHDARPATTQGFSGQMAVQFPGTTQHAAKRYKFDFEVAKEDPGQAAQGSNRAKEMQKQSNK